LLDGHARHCLLEKGERSEQKVEELMGAIGRVMSR
jgi:hypothetical protein